MDQLNQIDQVILEIQSNTISCNLPFILSLALECRDYSGYCVLSHWNYPIANNPQANAIQRKEIIRTLMLNGLSIEDASTIEQQSTEEYLEMKTLSNNEVSSHSAKEIETWLIDVKRIVDSPNNVMTASIEDLINRQLQMQKLYEGLRSYVIAKLTYYKQVYKLAESTRLSPNKNTQTVPQISFSKVFVVHGHNGEIKEAVARLIEKQGIQAIILHEQANQGATIIEKFERNSDVGCAVCLFTADDLGRAKTDVGEKERARQNVVFEAGYFIGKLGRHRVIIVADKGVEIPSDLQGVVYTETTNWQYSVLKELKAIGYNIDYNKLD